ncbi:MAG TPA: NAD(P)/FAD-dependent oxidoreductase [Vicinamibacteria bacterium]|nr:NAD(P)/FAD-dependent oxidoreductase [Vicinamibacteria bacterium]
MADTGLTVVGAGVVGLAVAARVARRVTDVVVIERRERHGQEASSRNSEVIHAGLYYPSGSLKAELCVRGNRLLYELAERRKLPHRATGKLIVAMDRAEVPELERLLARGCANGVELRMLTGKESRALEPNVPAVAALWSPTTGVISAHALMDALLQEAREQGATLQPRAELVGVERSSSDYALTVRTPEGQETFTSERVVNAGGLEADTVSRLAGIDVDAAGYRLHWCKGSYFAVAPRKAGLVSRLVYPVPGAVSLGVHAVVDLAGGLKFGPDAEYLPERRADFTVDPALRDAFAQGVRRLLPAIAPEDLAPDMAGIRAKLQGPGDGFRDFVVREEGERGLPGWVSLVGIDSPGLTSTLAIAERVDALLS